MSGAELAQRLKQAQADPGLLRDLAALAGNTTDDLGPIRRSRPECLDNSVFIANETGRLLDE